MSCFGYHLKTFVFTRTWITPLVRVFFPSQTSPFYNVTVVCRRISRTFLVRKLFFIVRHNSDFGYFMLVELQQIKQRCIIVIFSIWGCGNNYPLLIMSCGSCFISQKITPAQLKFVRKLHCQKMAYRLFKKSSIRWLWRVLFVSKNWYIIIQLLCVL